MDKKKLVIQKLDRFINQRVLPRRFSTSIILFLFGAFLYYKFMHNKEIEGWMGLILMLVIYLSLGVGLYGLFSWFVIKLFQALAYIFRLVFRGQVQITVSRDKISSKLVYK